MDGHTYAFQEAYSPAANMQLALRRGDNRFRIQVEQQVYKLLWVAVQTGYKQNINFSYDLVQDGKDKPIYVAGAPNFTAKNKLSNQLYFNITLYVAAPK